MNFEDCETLYYTDKISWNKKQAVTQDAHSNQMLVNTPKHSQKLLQNYQVVPKKNLKCDKTLKCFFPGTKT